MLSAAALGFGMAACGGGSQLTGIASAPEGVQSLPLPAAKSYTIDFNGLKNGQAFKKYSEYGFQVTAGANDDWVVNGSYGNPAPMIQFPVPADKIVTNAVTVTHATERFTYKSVDLYSSLSPVKWKFAGSLKGKTVYSQSGQMPNPTGGFTTLKNGHAGAAVDKVDITLTNVKVPCCGNEIGIDNIVLATGT